MNPGSARLRGQIRTCAADFVVEELAAFAADGTGEHDVLWVEKTGANTPWVAAQLARFARVNPVAVGYCGLKDRHALTRQQFSVQLPGRRVDWSLARIEGVRILQVARHSRKLQRGSHRGNRFDLRVRRVAGERSAAEQVLRQVREHGAPNAFGAQRFGRAGNNLGLVQRLAAAQAMDRTQRGFALSTARAQLFNAVLQARVDAGDWDRLREGDVAQLDGSNSCFPVSALDAALQQRCTAMDLHPTGPLWGTGQSRTAGSVAQLEAEVAALHPECRQVLESAGLRAERRALRMRVAELEWRWDEPSGDLCLRFTLPRGCYATALLATFLDTEAPDTGADPSDPDED